MTTMGQYHYVVNLDKKQYLHPHRFNDGLKLLEFGCSAEGTMTALAILLAEQSVDGGRGGGDLHSDDPLVGSWAGDRITIAGDYAGPGEIGWDADAGASLFAVASEQYEELSQRLLPIMANGV